MSKTVDIIIVGGGPIGINCAILAKQHGLNALILEKGTIVNSLYHFPTNMTFFSTSKLLEIGDVPFISHSDKPTRKESLEYFRRVVNSWDLNVNTFEQVEDINEQDQGFEVISNKNKYHAKYVIVATGFYDKVRKLNILGEDLPKVKHYYDEPHPYVGQKIVVVGGANSACDVALETFHKGADVTMVVRKDSLYEKVKYWILPNIKNRIKEGSIKAHFNSNVKEIREGEVDIETPDGKLTIENDFVLAMTGYQPNFTFLEKIGLSFSDDKARIPVYKEETLESNIDNLYLAGVVCGGMRTSTFFIENTRVHAEMLMQDIVMKESLA